METILTYRGRAVTDADVAFMRELIATSPGASRRALSHKVCHAWSWMQPNGHPRDMVCRGMMLELHRAGHIELPAAQWTFSDPHNRKRVQPAAVEVDRTVVQGVLDDLGELSFRQVRRCDEEALFDGLIATHHYLGYTQPVGEHLKFLVTARERPVACFAWSSAPRHLGPRDRYIGWSPEVRRRNLRFLAYNSRFLILPWVQVRYLASHLLGRMVRLLPEEWEKVYGHPVYFAETFVDPTRYRGTCYRAANWVVLGQTTGRGKDDQTRRPNRTIKDVLGLALTDRFRERLREGA
jgi:hypothetical protein